MIGVFVEKVRQPVAMVTKVERFHHGYRIG